MLDIVLNEDINHCTFGKSVQRDVDLLEKLFLLTGGTKMTQNFRIAHRHPNLDFIFWKIQCEVL